MTDTPADIYYHVTRALQAFREQVKLAAAQAERIVAMERAAAGAAWPKLLDDDYLDLAEFCDGAFISNRQAQLDAFDYAERQLSYYGTSTKRRDKGLQIIAEGRANLLAKR